MRRGRRVGNIGLRYVAAQSRREAPLTRGDCAATLGRVRNRSRSIVSEKPCNGFRVNLVFDSRNIQT